MRLLFLASYFPKPTNPTMGTWALEQAQAFRRAGIEVRVRSYNSWFPGFLSMNPGIRRYNRCPPRHEWNGLRVDYPRAPIYPFEAFNAPMHRRPLLQLELAWPFVRRGLFRAVEEFRPDVIFAHHGSPNGFLALRIHRRYGLPFILSDHRLADVADARRLAGRRKLYRRIGEAAAALIGVSSTMSDAYRAILPPDLHGRIHTVYNGGDVAMAAADPPPRPAELAEKLVVTSVGIFHERKALPLLVRAFGRVAGKHPRAVLRIIGDGHDRPAVERAIRETGMESRITLCGLLPHEHVTQELAWCDLFALVGWDEPWGVVYNEAMAAGKPILCANDGGINDVLVNGENALTVPPRDEGATAAALDRLLSDAELRRRLGQAGHELFLSRLTWDANARAMKAIFEAALSAVPPQRREIQAVGG